MKVIDLGWPWRSLTTSMVGYPSNSWAFCPNHLQLMWCYDVVGAAVCCSYAAPGFWYVTSWWCFGSVKGLFDPNSVTAAICLCIVFQLYCFLKLWFISPPWNDSFREDLSFTADVLKFFISIIGSPRCIGQSARNFARWSVLGRSNFTVDS